MLPKVLGLLLLSSVPSVVKKGLVLGLLFLCALCVLCGEMFWVLLLSFANC
jgi:hypothetical protein